METKKQENINNYLKGAKFFWAFFVDLIFPIECINCGEEGEWLCTRCFHKIKIKKFQYCFGCKDKKILGKFCRHCRKDYFLDGIWIAGYYDDELLGKLVKSLKYYLVEDISFILGKFLALFIRDLVDIRRLPDANLGNCRTLDNIGDSLVIPLPLHAKRRRRRGFNQAELIALKFCEHLNLKIASRNLVRIKNNRPQAKLKEKERQVNIKGCFGWVGNDLDGKNVILVDDVATTGATLNEAARILKLNGVGEVWGLVVAKG